MNLNLLNNLTFRLRYLFIQVNTIQNKQFALFTLFILHLMFKPILTYVFPEFDYGFQCNKKIFFTIIIQH